MAKKTNICMIDVKMAGQDPMVFLELTQEKNRETICKHLKNGIIFLSTDGVIIDSKAEIGKNTVILPSTIISGDTKIGENCTIGPNSVVSSCTLGNDVVFNSSQCYDSIIGNGCTVGPFAHIRPDSVLKENVHLGDFVEVKNSTIDDETHVSHLTYVGDSDVGKRVNFGCGVVTVNYNGRKKARCTIGDDAFIGCNTNLVAPVTVHKKGYTAAGSTITHDVPEAALAIARAPQVVKEEYNR